MHSTADAERLCQLGESFAFFPLAGHRKHDVVSRFQQAPYRVDDLRNSLAAVQAPDDENQMLARRQSQCGADALARVRVWRWHIYAVFYQCDPVDAVSPTYQ
jgi:hypothetical protein